MKPTIETPTPDLDMILLRGGYPVADSPKIRQLRSVQMHRTERNIAKALAVLFGWLAEKFEHRAGQTDTATPTTI